MQHKIIQSLDNRFKAKFFKDNVIKLYWSPRFNRIIGNLVMYGKYLQHKSYQRAM